MYDQYEEYREKNPRTKYSVFEYILQEISNQAIVGDDATITSVKHAYGLLESTMEPSKDVAYDSFLLMSNLALEGGITSLYASCCYY
ncbi:unnamed protein product [Aphanomyces euteiches]